MPSQTASTSPASERPSLRVLQGFRQCSGQTRPSFQAEPKLCTGRILELHPDLDGRAMWHVQPHDETAASNVLPAIRAAGCLLEPSPGDLVLLLRRSHGPHYVLNVLEKQEDACTLRFPGDLTLDASRGSFSLQAEKLDLTGSDSAALYSPEVTLAGQLGRLRFVRLDILAKDLVARMQCIKSVADRILQTASNVTSRVGRMLRLTGFELHRAGTMRTEVEERFTVETGQADILARDEVTVDAKKIHLG